MAREDTQRKKSRRGTHAFSLSLTHTHTHTHTPTLSLSHTQTHTPLHLPLQTFPSPLLRLTTLLLRLPLAALSSLYCCRPRPHPVLPSPSTAKEQDVHPRPHHVPQHWRRPPRRHQDKSLRQAGGLDWYGSLPARPPLLPAKAHRGVTLPHPTPHHHTTNRSHVHDNNKGDGGHFGQADGAVPAVAAQGKVPPGARPDPGRGALLLLRSYGNKDTQGVGALFSSLIQHHPQPSRSSACAWRCAAVPRTRACCCTLMATASRGPPPTASCGSLTKTLRSTCRRPSTTSRHGSAAPPSLCTTARAPAWSSTRSATLPSSASAVRVESEGKTYRKTTEGDAEGGGGRGGGSTKERFVVNAESPCRSAGATGPASTAQGEPKQWLRERGWEHRRPPPPPSPPLNVSTTAVSPKQQSTSGKRRGLARCGRWRSL